MKGKRRPRKKLTTVRLAKGIWALFRMAIIIGIAYVILYPILVKVSVSFMAYKDMADMSVRWIPRNPTLDNFKAVIPMIDYADYLFTTLGIAVAATVLQVISTSLAAYGLAKFKFRGRTLIYFMVILTMVVPPSTYMTASYHQYRYFDFFGIGGLFGMTPITLINTPWPLMMLSVCCMAVKNGLFIYILQQFFRNMPHEINEAAFVDGAGPLKTFTSVILPNAVPALTTVTVFSFVWNWNDNYTATTYMPRMHIFPNALNNLNFELLQKMGGLSDVDPIQVSQYTNAAVLLIILPLMAFFLITQKFFVEGVERTGLTGL